MNRHYRLATCTLVPLAKYPVSDVYVAKQEEKLKQVKLCHFHCKPWVAITNVVLPYNCDHATSTRNNHVCQWCKVTFEKYEVTVIRHFFQ